MGLFCVVAEEEAAIAVKRAKGGWQSKLDALERADEEHNLREQVGCVITGWEMCKRVCVGLGFWLMLVNEWVGKG